MALSGLLATLLIKITGDNSQAKASMRELQVQAKNAGDTVENSLGGGFKAAGQQISVVTGMVGKLTAVLGTAFAGFRAGSFIGQDILGMNPQRYQEDAQTTVDAVSLLGAKTSEEIDKNIVLAHKKTAEWQTALLGEQANSTFFFGENVDLSSGLGKLLNWRVEHAKEQLEMYEGVVAALERRKASGAPQEALSKEVRDEEALRKRQLALQSEAMTESQRLATEWSGVRSKLMTEIGEERVGQNREGIIRGLQEILRLENDRYQTKIKAALADEQAVTAQERAVEREKQRTSQSIADKVEDTYFRVTNYIRGKEREREEAQRKLDDEFLKKWQDINNQFLERQADNNRQLIENTSFGSSAALDALETMTLRMRM